MTQIFLDMATSTTWAIRVLEREEIRTLIITWSCCCQEVKVGFADEFIEQRWGVKVELSKKPT